MFTQSTTSYVPQAIDQDLVAFFKIGFLLGFSIAVGAYPFIQLLVRISMMTRYNLRSRLRSGAGRDEEANQLASAKGKRSHQIRSTDLKMGKLPKPVLNSGCGDATGTISCQRDVALDQSPNDWASDKDQETGNGRCCLKEIPREIRNKIFEFVVTLDCLATPGHDFFCPSEGCGLSRTLRDAELQTKLTVCYGVFLTNRQFCLEAYEIFTYVNRFRLEERYLYDGQKTLDGMPIPLNMTLMTQRRITQPQACHIKHFHFTVDFCSTGVEEIPQGVTRDMERNGQSVTHESLERQRLEGTYGAWTIRSQNELSEEYTNTLYGLVKTQKVSFCALRSLCIVMKIHEPLFVERTSGQCGITLHFEVYFHPSESRGKVDEFPPLKKLMSRWGSLDARRRIFKPLQHMENIQRVVVKRSWIIAYTALNPEKAAAKGSLTEQTDPEKVLPMNICHHFRTIEEMLEAGGEAFVKFWSVKNGIEGEKVKQIRIQEGTNVWTPKSLYDVRLS